MSRENHSSIADYRITIAGDIRRRGVLHQVRVFRPKRVQCGKHRYGRAQPAHRNVFVAAGVVEPACVPRQQLVDGFVVLDARGGIVFVPGYENLRNRFADSYEVLEADGAEGNGNKGEARYEHLEKWQLHFERM